MLDHSTTPTKVCSSCGVEKPVTAFSPRGEAPHLLRSHCNDCRKAAKAEYKRRNKERVDASDARYRAEQSAALKERQKEWREAHPERIREISRDSKRRHADERREYNHRWGRENRDKTRAHSAKRQARKRNAPVNDYTAAQWQETLAYFNHACAYCGATGVPLEQEHMVPLSRGGGHTASNVVPACRFCNASKNNRNLVEHLMGIVPVIVR